MIFKANINLENFWVKGLLEKFLDAFIEIQGVNLQSKLWKKKWLDKEKFMYSFQKMNLLFQEAKVIQK